MVSKNVSGFRSHASGTGDLGRDRDSHLLVAGRFQFHYPYVIARQGEGGGGLAAGIAGQFPQCMLVAHYFCLGLIESDRCA